MRPLRLEVEGFGTFRDRTVVDFADLDLVAFVGPTGSGKSTVIDAITFALYGSVARYDNPSLVAPVIHQLSTEAKVRFDFELGGDAYTAVRVVRRQKSKPGAAPRATTKEARLERWTTAAPTGGTGADGASGGEAEAAAGVDRRTDGSTTVLAGSVSELDDEVVRLLGLDFRQFTRTIVLPQGDFAEFLTDDPGNRQKLLRRLLDIDVYARMGVVARDRAKQAAAQIEIYRNQLAKLADVTPDRLARTEALVIRLTETQEEVASQLSELGEIDVDLTRRRDVVNRIDADLGRLAAIDVPDGVDEIDEATSTAKAALVDAEAALAQRRQERDALAERHASIGDPAVLTQQLALRERAAEVDEQLVATRRDLAAALERQVETDAALRAHEEALVAAQRAVSAARTGVDAVDWITRLQEGEPCPICQQPVTAVPEHAAEERARERELCDREAAVETAHEAVTAARTAAARAGAKVEALEATAAELTERAASVADALEGVSTAAELAAALGAANAAVEERTSAAVAVAEAERAADGATRRFSEAEEAETTFRRRLLAARDTVAGLEPPTPSDRSLADDWEALRLWGQERSAALATERADLARVGKELAAAKAAVVDRIGDTVAALDLDVDPDPATVAAALAAARAGAERDVAHLQDRLDHKAELETSAAALDEARAVDEALGRQHLAAGGFERWLLAEALDDIVARATVRLNELSNGRYSLEADDGSFHVRDHGNADERRDVRTLSGGETFLASLALALALADSIAELAPVDSPRLSSIFLDEGFGTLDGETLDVLASAIEELSAGGRLVAIVTHVRDLAERMPVRFEVRKGSTTSTIERRDG